MAHGADLEQLPCLCSTPFDASMTITAESAASGYGTYPPRNPGVPAYPEY